jgi:signal transduction histidine kinase
MTVPSISVLFIEDNPGDARLVQEALKGTSDPAYRVEWVESLSSGLAHLADGGIDVLLLDLGLPDSQGLAALTLIRHLAPAVPVVVLSGTDDEQLAVEAVREGAQDYLVKSHADHYLLTRSLRYAIERKRADEALRESEERLRLALTAANEVIWEYAPGTGFAERNETSDRISRELPETGSPAELWAARMHSEDQERVFRSFSEALEGQALSWSAEYRFLSADGEWSDIRDRAIIARDSLGKVTRVVGAMLDVTDLRRAQEALQESNQRLHQLSRDLLRAQDYERRRIARELHDSTAQLLAALSINLSRLQEPGLEPDRRRQVLSEAGELAAACSAEIRTVTCLLHPPLLDEVGLPSALQSYAQGFNQRTGIQVEIKIPPDFGRLNREMEAALFRIVQEGLANVHKHSGSQLAVVWLERNSLEIRLVLQDRGHGLQEVLRNQAKGFVRFGVGIIGMRERAEQLGGRLELTSNDIGARLTVTLPLVHSDEENANIVGG